MTEAEFQESVKELFNQTLVDGPGPRTTAGIVADQLIDYICDEAGYRAPTAVKETLRRMRLRMASIEQRNT